LSLNVLGSLAMADGGGFETPTTADFYQPLLDGTHPDYRLVATFKSPPGAAVLAYGSLFRNGVEDDFTNLDKINPEIRVFARRGVEVSP